MMRLATPFVLLVLACAASSEPREPVPPAPPAPPHPADARAPTVDVMVDSPEAAPADARDLPTQPRTTFPLLSVTVAKGGSLVTIGAGKDLGVNKTWKAYLVNKDGSRVAGGELTITAVQSRTSSATSKLPPDKATQPGVQAHLAPY